jgi:hypothetical protein
MMGALLIIATSVQAQVSGETEVGATRGQADGFTSQYVFYARPNLNMVARYFFVNGQVNRAEFAIGPTFKLGRWTWKAQFGIDTGREIKDAGVLSAKIKDRQLVYIYDLNASTRRDVDPGWIYQKAWLAISTDSVWQYRFESLHVGRTLAFLRLGGEWQHQARVRVIEKENVPTRVLYIAPYYDTVSHSPGIQAGFRFIDVP